ncbi:hypothetical protein HBHAL_3290 [Halobacillus halophilus DSM 2266]|uniref:Uncharacterized protein n=1 Tax=Halobacillus halophilus (strain ATCC 35676 / DSM 2266 / JCM 20832 / KCTC 3685 / LMG 17431 / NBRC 102448 / NCIMB 2269) TaxID=866895 RepID=I0JNB6_HALH3|nr:hypothetical protein HBHAL_3290 [Halobacillus halophilus DSM 2266]
MSWIGNYLVKPEHSCSGYFSLKNGNVMNLT